MRTTRLFFSTAARKPSIPALKFKFDRATANRKLVEHSNMLEVGAPDKHQTLPETSDHDPVTESYEPCYSANVRDVTSEYIAEFGFTRLETSYVLQTINNQPQMVPQSYLVTDWYSCKGRLGKIDYPFGTTKTQFYAGFEYPRALIEPVIRTPYVGELKPLNEKMMTAFGTKKIVKPHEMTRTNAIEKVIAALHDLERERAKEAVISTAVTKYGRYPDGGIKINSINVMFKKSDFNLFSYYVGVYVYQYPFNNFNRYKFLNAHTGQINGNRVLSVTKFTTAGAIFGGMVTVLTSLANPYLIPIRMSVQIAVGAGLSGALSGAFARLFNQYDRYYFVNETKRERAENSSFPHSREDREAQQFADAMNREYEYTSPAPELNRPSLPKEKLSLLGLDPDLNITLEALHAAYIAKIKQCHPDVSHLNEVDANAMTSAVNIAYQTLKKLLEQHEAENGSEQTARPGRP